MSETTVEDAEATTLKRSFTAEFSPGAGRTLDVRIVPYDKPEYVSDNNGPLYREEWAPSAFAEQLVAGHRLKLLMNFEHRQGAADVIGKGISIRSLADGLHGSFEVRRSEAGDMALDYVNDGILEGISLEAKPKPGGTIRTAEGIVRRVRAHLHRVALCQDGAFPDAKVLAVRSEPDYAIDEELLPVPIEEDLIETLRSQGFALPDRYTTHPAQTDTPAQSGTSEAAPVTDTDNRNGGTP